MLIEKILELKKRFINGRADPSDTNTIDGWFEQAKRLMLLKSLKDHDGIKYVLEIFEGEINKINEQLNKSYSKDLKDTERDRLLDKRDLAQKYVSLFKNVEEDIEKIESMVDSVD
jgi:hypothetical protein